MSDIDHIIETALAHQRDGRLEEAADIYRKVLEIDPIHADAIHLLSMIAYAQKNYDEAIELIGKAILVNPSAADFHINIASVFLATGNAKQAKSHAQNALKIDDKAGEAHYNLGNAYFAEGNAEEASTAFERAIELDGDNQSYWANYLFALNFSGNATAEDIFAANCKWGALLEGSLPPAPEFSNDLSSERRLKLGYFLPELDTHVTTRFLAPIFAAHDKAAFEIICYGYRSDGGGPPQAIGEAVDQWIDVGGKTTAEIAEIMRTDKIDILAHPCSFKSRYREVLAHRGAPVQIACTNLVSTTGLTATDYLVSDGFIDPLEHGAPHYTEQLIRLTGFNTYQKIEEAGEVAALPALVNDGVTFGSCNNIAKLSPQVIAAWSEILSKTPKSRLLLKHRAFEGADRRARIFDAFGSYGITEDRLIFEGFTADANAYISVYNKIDIALVPFPFGGGTVSYEAIWMGVPVVTLAGDVFMGRLTGSLMHRLGITECVTSTVTKYIAAAVHLAGDLDALTTLREVMRERAKATIFDAEAHVQELEAALKECWAKYCADKS